MMIAATAVVFVVLFSSAPALRAAKSTAVACGNGTRILSPCPLSLKTSTVTRCASGDIPCNMCSADITACGGSTCPRAVHYPPATREASVKNAFYGSFDSCVAKTANFVGSTVLPESAPSWLRTDPGAAGPETLVPSGVGSGIVRVSLDDIMNAEKVVTKCLQICSGINACQDVSYGYENGWFCKMYTGSSCDLPTYKPNVVCNPMDVVTFTRSTTNELVPESEVYNFFKGCTKPIAQTSLCDPTNSNHLMMALSGSTGGNLTDYPPWNINSLSSAAAKTAYATLLAGGTTFNSIYVQCTGLLGGGQTAAGFLGYGSASIKAVV